MSDEQEIGVAWRRAVGTGHRSSRVLASLVGRHREAHRRYHDLRHVCWVLRHVDELATVEPPADLDAVIVAACFHDAVYDPRSQGNEAASARLARRELAELGWDPVRIEAVAAMVEATAGHVTGETASSAGASSIAAPIDVAVLLDADLAVLGAPPNAYSAYVNGVRAEYAHLSDHEWRVGRAAVIRGLLARAALYHTPAARERWEVRARANLAAELASLETA